MFVFDAMTDTAILNGRSLCTDNNTKTHYLVATEQGRKDAKKINQEVLQREVYNDINHIPCNW